MGAAYLPHPEKVATGGEDAHYTSECKRLVAVADGVGGWKDMGVDSGLFSRELMELVGNYVSETSDVDPYAVMEHAYKNVEAIGTSTICVLSVQKGKLTGCNLGDSGFAVFRRGGEPGDASEEYKIVFRTDDQTHFFNCPFQIGTNSNDGPEKADQVELDVASGDVVVAATDGIFDNLFDEDVERELNNALGKDAGHGEEGTEALLQEAANEICVLSQVYGLDPNRHGPFSHSAKSFGYEYSGGKIDDSTVVVAFVV